MGPFHPPCATPKRREKHTRKVKFCFRSQSSACFPLQTESPWFSMAVSPITVFVPPNTCISFLLFVPPKPRPISIIRSGHPVSEPADQTPLSPTATLLMMQPCPTHCPGSREWHQHKLATSHVLSHLSQKAASALFTHLKLKRKFIVRVFGHIPDVGVKVIQLNWALSNKENVGCKNLTDRFWWTLCFSNMSNFLG